jgi:hypothetical protein
MKSTSRFIQAVIALLSGLFAIVINPGLVDVTVNKFLMGMTEKGTAPMGAVPALRLFVSFTWRGVEVFAGIALLLAAYGFIKNRKWAFPMALVSLATMPIGSFYISSFAGYMVRKHTYAPSFTAFIVGLLAFWLLIILEKKGKEMWALMVPLTLLGMIGTQAFAFSEHGLRGLFQAGLTASIQDPSVGILRYSGPIMAMVLLTLFAAIYYIAAQKKLGWWLGLVVGLGMAIAAIPVHFARPKASFSLAGSSAFAEGAAVKGAATPSIFTSVYFLGGMLGLLLVVVLLIPFFKNRLLLQIQEDSVE